MKPYKRQVISEMQRIGSEVRTRRKRLKLSQNDLASWIQVKPRRYGYFETGRARLTTSQIAEIEARLDAAEKGDEYLRHRPLNLLPERNFLSVQQKLRTGRKYSDFWLFGLRHLPILRDATYETAWRENLRSGINYRLVWCLDEELSDVTVQLLETTISKVVVSAHADSAAGVGTVTIYGICIGDPKESRRSRASSLLVKEAAQFSELAKRFKKLGPQQAIITKGPIVMSGAKYETCRPILHYGWLRSVVFYQGAQDLDSYAAVFLENVSNDPKASGSGESGWTFLTPFATAALRIHIRAFAEAVPA